LSVGEQYRYFALAPLLLLTTKYSTPTTVRCVENDGNEKNYHIATVWCVPDEQAWQRICNHHRTLQGCLDRLAGALLPLRYHDVLVQQGGITVAPNPLSNTVIHCTEEPDDLRNKWNLSPFALPKLERIGVVEHHTPKMLRTTYLHRQEKYFVCPDDATWEQIVTLYRELEEARDGFFRFRDDLGTYSAALLDRRYAQWKIADGNAGNVFHNNEENS
jgi:hypothetical protein